MTWKIESKIAAFFSGRADYAYDTDNIVFYKDGVNYPVEKVLYCDKTSDSPTLVWRRYWEHINYTVKYRYYKDDATGREFLVWDIYDQDGVELLDGFDPDDLNKLNSLCKVATNFYLRPNASEQRQVIEQVNSTYRFYHEITDKTALYPDKSTIITLSVLTDMNNERIPESGGLWAEDIYIDRTGGTAINYKLTAKSTPWIAILDNSTNNKFVFYSDVDLTTKKHDDAQHVLYYGTGIVSCEDITAVINQGTGDMPSEWHGHGQNFLTDVVVTQVTLADGETAYKHELPKAAGENLLMVYYGTVWGGSADYEYKLSFYIFDDENSHDVQLGIGSENHICNWTADGATSSTIASAPWSRFSRLGYVWRQ